MQRIQHRQDGVVTRALPEFESEGSCGRRVLGVNCEVVVGDNVVPVTRLTSNIT